MRPESPYEIEIAQAASKAVDVIVAMKKSGLHPVLVDKDSAQTSRVHSLLKLLAFGDGAGPLPSGVRDEFMRHMTELVKVRLTSSNLMLPENLRSIDDCFLI